MTDARSANQSISGHHSDTFSSYEYVRKGSVLEYGRLVVIWQMTATEFKVALPTLSYHYELFFTFLTIRFVSVSAQHERGPRER